MRQQGITTLWPGRRAATWLCSAAALLAATLGTPPRSDAAEKVVVSTIGSPQTGGRGAQFDNPQGVAVNDSGAGGVPAGTWYVVDADNARIQRFSPGGNFVAAWGWGVKDKAPEYEICTDATACWAGTPGAGAGQLSGLTFGGTGGGEGRGAAVDPATGTLFVADQAEQDRRIDAFAANGSALGAIGWNVRPGGGAEGLELCTPATGCAGGTTGAKGGQFGALLGGLAVAPPSSPNAGHLYVTNSSSRRIDEFAPNFQEGVLTGVSFVRSFGWNVANGGGIAFEVCSDAASCRAGNAGTGLGQFGTNSPTDVAVAPSGTIYVLDATNRRITTFSPTPEPLASSFGQAAVETAFGPNPVLLNLAIDRDSGNLFVGGVRASGGVAVAELDSAGILLSVHGTDLTAGAIAGLATAPQSTGGNLYLSSGPTGPLQGVYILGEGPVQAPVTVFDGTTATFQGDVVSNGFAATWRFEYSADGVNWRRAPTQAGQVAAQAGSVTVSSNVTGLTGSTTYHVRLYQNRPGGPGSSLSHETTFTTLPASPAVSSSPAAPLAAASATLNAYLDPQEEPTTYYFEYGTEPCATVPDPCTATPAQSASGGGLRLVSAPVTGLSPSTTYHFRVIASNGTGTSVGEEESFETFTPGSSLPEDRAYELVTPPDTGASYPTSKLLGDAGGFDCFPVSFLRSDRGSAEGLAYQLFGGALPGLDVTGGNDLYEATRSPDGWVTEARSPSGQQSSQYEGGLCTSEGNRYSTLLVGEGGEGSLHLPGTRASYIRNPEGSYQLAGQGALGTDPEANVRFLSDDGRRVIFTSLKRLESDAPSTVGPGPVDISSSSDPNPPVAAVYDRDLLSGETQTVSLLPSGEASDPAVETVHYIGTSGDGSSVVFYIEEELDGKTTWYERRNGETSVIASGPTRATLQYGGMSSDGDTVAYVEWDGLARHDRGKLFLYEAASGNTRQITSDDHSILVNVPADPANVYFTTAADLTGPEENSQGAVAEEGTPNLYVWNRATGETKFVANLTSRDISEFNNFEASLAAWSQFAVASNPNATVGPGNAASRATADGSVLLFESRADSTPYDSAGFSEIYRYDADAGDLECVSCPPQGVLPMPAAQELATGNEWPNRIDAALQPQLSFRPTNSLARLQNLTADGRKVFFQTVSPLVPQDANDTFDVYEWVDGQVYLLSSGRSSLPSLLYAMSPSGADVFISTNDRLLPADPSSIASIYDIREGGGFPEQPVVPGCDPDVSCQGTPPPPPPLPVPGTASVSGTGNLPKAQHRRKKRRHHHRRRHRRRHHTRGQGHHGGAQGRNMR